MRKKLGNAQPDDIAPPPRKRRRVKSYISVLMVDNFLRIAAGARLTDFITPTDADGQPVGSPFSWRSLSLATDSGPDMVLPSVAVLSLRRFYSFRQRLVHVQSGQAFTFTIGIPSSVSVPPVDIDLIILFVCLVSGVLYKLCRRGCP